MSHSAPDRSSDNCSSDSAPGHRLLSPLSAPLITLIIAIQRSGILKQFPYIDLTAQKVGVFGRLVKLDAPLKAGDRVKIYRGIIADPETVSHRDMVEE